MRGGFVDESKGVQSYPIMRCMHCLVKVFWVTWTENWMLTWNTILLISDAVAETTCCGNHQCTCVGRISLARILPHEGGSKAWVRLTCSCRVSRTRGRIHPSCTLTNWRRLLHAQLDVCSDPEASPTKGDPPWRLSFQMEMSRTAAPVKRLDVTVRSIHMAGLRSPIVQAKSLDAAHHAVGRSRNRECSRMCGGTWRDESEAWGTRTVTVSLALVTDSLAQGDSRATVHPRPGTTKARHDVLLNPYRASRPMTRPTFTRHVVGLRCEMGARAPNMCGMGANIRQRSRHGVLFVRRRGRCALRDDGSTGYFDVP
ncbi:hypothetical protein P154DRAFT_17187 [Amniculicola lignicola CBS 123094]|uniref:Uncharacterized protein n=1 Tax=Amniculicola lignicola CBS 123094 TaxID=1392246 RepID=A0A6A5X5G5_9PLEO|nr:hypothetical protein P154DRAFT_17187 [Amniculicola lignicola CBS 123094]